MLSPVLKTFRITPEIRQKIEDKVLEAVFKSIRDLPPRRTTPDGIPTITVTEAKERLEVALPEYADVVGSALSLGRTELGLTAREFGKRLHEWINEASLFFRREGADYLRQGLALESEEAFRKHVWSRLFSEKILTLAQSQDMLRDEGVLQTCDLVVESMKLWTYHVCTHLWGYDAAEFSPTAFFLDTETDVQANLSRNGVQIHLRGKPDAIFFDQRQSEVHVWEYKFGRQGQLELQIAQVLLYMALIESAKGVHCSGGCLTFFTVAEEVGIPTAVSGTRKGEQLPESFHAPVERAFEGFIGNDQAVYLLKVQLTLALREDPPRTAINVMFCGPGGTGKTELARRVAETLGTPFVDIPAPTIKNVDDLVDRIDRVLQQEARDPKKVGVDSGLPLYKYPPVVVFIDEVHALAKRADAFLNLFEPKERRAVCREFVADFHDATFLTATTEKGKLPSPFLSRFRIIDLQPYTLEEVRQIAELEFKKVNEACSAEVLELLAKVGRLVPRQVIERAKHFIDLHMYGPTQ
ncbi:MAG: AAA family ATPase, partial [Deltaproteobacteria bacterium]|nr:AAA family ATPase [Deltaproteobacteria bacterium]